MLIGKNDLEIFAPLCEPGAERFAAITRLKIDISEALPLLNAALSVAVYHRRAKALDWKKGGHSIAFHSTEIAASNIEDNAPAIGG